MPLFLILGTIFIKVLLINNTLAILGRKSNDIAVEYVFKVVKEFSTQGVEYHVKSVKESKILKILE